MSLHSINTLKMVSKPYTRSTVTNTRLGKIRNDDQVLHAWVSQGAGELDSTVLSTLPISMQFDAMIKVRLPFLPLHRTAMCTFFHTKRAAYQNPRPCGRVSVMILPISPSGALNHVQLSAPRCGEVMVARG